MIDLAAGHRALGIAPADMAALVKKLDPTLTDKTEPESRTVERRIALHDQAARAYQLLGDFPAAERVVQAGLDLTRQRAATDAGNVDWAREVASFDSRLGEVRRARNDLAGALAAYREGRG